MLPIRIGRGASSSSNSLGPVASRAFTTACGFRSSTPSRPVVVMHAQWRVAGTSKILHLPKGFQTTRGFAISSSSRRNADNTEGSNTTETTEKIKKNAYRARLSKKRENNRNSDMMNKLFNESVLRHLAEQQNSAGKAQNKDDIYNMIDGFMRGHSTQSRSSHSSKEQNTGGVAGKLVLDGVAEPVKVQIIQTKHAIAWTAFRWGLVTVLLIAGASTLSDTLASVNVGKGLGLSGSKKNEPVEDTGVSLDDVKGCDEVKEELEEIIAFLKDSEKFTKMGARLPRGLLLSGPPGTGKTLLARAIAGEAGVPFFQASGSDFEEVFVGVGARRIRDLFAAARKKSPSIVFIDEIDAVAQSRSSRDNASMRMTLNQLLVELDGFSPKDSVVVLCATNLPKGLDKALLRPGRLDKTVVVPHPDLKGRKEILQLYGEKIQLDEDVDLDVLARRTAGMTGADLFNVLNIAAVRASAKGFDTVTEKELEEAFDRVVVGLERKNPMSEDEKYMTAYHEGGHTLVGWFTPEAEKVHKATIMPRGQALGVTWSIPEKEKYSQKLCELKARLKVLMGGKIAEELIYGPENVSSGCTSDLEQATKLARAMVMQFGMAGDPRMADDKVAKQGLLYLDMDEYSVLSEQSKRMVDFRTEQLLQQAYKDSTDILKSHKRQLKDLADAMVEHETLSHEEIKLAIEGNLKKIRELRKEKEEKAKIAFGERKKAQKKREEEQEKEAERERKEVERENQDDEDENTKDVQPSTQKTD